MRTTSLIVVALLLSVSAYATDQMREEDPTPVKDARHVLKETVSAYNEYRKSSLMAQIVWQSLCESAENGDNEAQYSLGVHYEMGLGCERDLRQAAVWYQKAVQKGHTESHYALATLYEKGEGVPEDKDTAVKLYQFAADRSHAESGLALDFLALEDDDKDKAFKWINKAAALGNKVAKALLLDLKASVESTRPDIRNHHVEKTGRD